MEKKIYIETSVVSYLVAPRSENIRIASHQLATEAMWTRLGDYSVFISDTVVEEAGRGNSDQVELRLTAIQGFHLLAIDDKVRGLAKFLVAEKAVPEQCPEDALHIAVAAANGIEFIVTWNFKHINNPFMERKISSTVELAGFNAPVVCSPEELLGETQ